jgi:hypothetical protein
MDEDNHNVRRGNEVWVSKGIFQPVISVPKDATDRDVRGVIVESLRKMPNVPAQRNPPPNFTVVVVCSYEITVPPLVVDNFAESHITVVELCGVQCIMSRYVSLRLCVRYKSDLCHRKWIMSMPWELPPGAACEKAGKF